MFWHLFWARLSAGLLLEGRAQLEDIVDCSQVDATSLWVLDHIVNQGFRDEFHSGDFSTPPLGLRD